MVIDREKLRDNLAVFVYNPHSWQHFNFWSETQTGTLHVSAVLGWRWEMGDTTTTYRSKYLYRKSSPAWNWVLKFNPKVSLSKIAWVFWDWEWRLSRRLVAVPPPHGCLSVLRGERRNKYEPIIVSQFSREHGARQCLHQPGHADH